MSPTHVRPSVPLTVLVLTAFGDVDEVEGDGELGRWLDGYEFDREVSVEGLPEPVRVTEDGVGVTATGMGPNRAASAATACFASDVLDTSEAYVLNAGIAGISPEVGTVGSVVLADHVVSWDAKQRTSGGAASRWWFGPAHAYEPDADLVAAARSVSEDVDLADPPAAREHRAAYEEPPASEPPGVTTGTTAAGADFWYGAELAEQVESLVDAHDAGTYAVTECEGFGVAVACDRFDKLDRYLPVRAASNFDRQPAGDGHVDPTARVDEPAIENAYRVGRAVAETVAADWERWRDGPPER